MSDNRRLSGLAAGLLSACGFFTSAHVAAQSSVSMYGLMDAYAGKRQLASASGAGTTVVDSGGLTTSFYGFRGTEDIGGGNSAIFDITGVVRLDSGDVGRFNGDIVFSRSSWVGLQGGWGTLRLGRMSSPNFLLAIRLGPFGDSTTFGPYLLHTYVGGQPLDAAIAPGGPAAASDSGYGNAVTYASPRLAGFQGSVAYSLGEVGDSYSENRRVSYSATYENGPVFAGLGLDRVHRPAIAPPPAVALASKVVQQDSVQLGGSYDFGPVKAFASHNRTATDLATGTARRFRTHQLGVSVPAGSGAVLVSAARTTKAETAIAGVRRTTYAAAYDHFLSKRTDLYAVAMRDEVTNLKSGTSFGLGMRHRF